LFRDAIANVSFPASSAIRLRHRAPISPVGKLIAEAGAFSLLDAGFTWIDPKPEPAIEGGAG
jgi:hypothetical protein